MSTRLILREGKRREEEWLGECLQQEKGLYGEAECTFMMHSEGEGSEWRRCSDEWKVSIWGRAASGVALEMMGRMEGRLN